MTKTVTMHNEAATAAGSHANYTAGTTTEALEALAAAFPERDSIGYVIGHYVYDNGHRIAGPFPTRDAAAEMVADHPRRDASWSIVCGHVATASGRLVRVAA